MIRSTELRLASVGARRHVLPRALLAALCTMAAGQVLAETPAAAPDAEVTTLDRLIVQGNRPRATRWRKPPPARAWTCRCGRFRSR